MDENKQLLEALALLGQVAQKQMGGSRLKHDLPTGFTATTNVMHGAGGIFGVPGTSREVFSTRVNPRGLMSALPAFPSNDDRPLVAYLTGFTDEESASEESGNCDDPIEAGQIKSCYMGAAFGRFRRKTEPLDLLTVGRRMHRGEMYDLRLVGDPNPPTSDIAVPGMSAGMAGFLQNDFMARIITLGVAFQNLIGPLAFTGTPTNNVGTGYQEFVGLETLIGTGKVDVLTSTACPSLDSDVKDFNYANVASNGSLLVQVLTMMMRFIRYNATRMRFNPVQFALVMRENLFHEIADIWPCAYNTYRCDSGAVDDANVARVMVDGERQRQMSDRYRNGEFLTIDGVDYPVIIDDYLPEDTSTTNANVPEAAFASDIYIIPLTVAGGMPVTYWEFLNYDGAEGVPAASQVLQSMQMQGGEFFSSDAGRFLWTRQHTAWCISWLAVTEPRLRLLTPHLAARLQNVVYSPLQHYRDVDPDDPYYADGGETYRTLAPYAATAVN